MPYPIALLAVCILFILSVAAARRRRLVDAHGNAELRYYGPALFCLGCGLAPLYPIALDATGLQPLPPGGAMPQLCLAAVGFLAALWFLRQRVTLTPDELLHERWPLRRRWYARSEIVAAGRDHGMLAVHLRDGRRIGFPPFASGERYLLVQLELITARARNETLWDESSERITCRH